MLSTHVRSAYVRVFWHGQKFEGKKTPWNLPKEKSGA